jgi:purine-binding chemotaxis protein CheW
MGGEDAALVSTFYLGEALFGIDTLDVQEVITLSNLTRVHHAPSYISGIINLRGQIVTVIDLAAKLGLEINTDTPPQQILIVSCQGEHVGLLVDRVADVEEADLDNLSPPPANIKLNLQKFLRGVCRVDTRQVSILDVNLVLNEKMDEN